MIYFVGVGPGDPELISIKAVHVLQNAGAIVLPDSGKNSAILPIIEKWIGNKPVHRVAMPMKGTRAQWNEAHSGSSIFSGKIICGCCGNIYGSKVWHSNDQYRRVVWQCNAKFKNAEKCTTPHLTEDQIKDVFVAAMNRLITDRDAVMEDCREIMHLLTDCSKIDVDLEKAQTERNVLEELLRRLIEQNAREPIDQEEYNARYGSLDERYRQQSERYEQLEAEKQRRLRLRDDLKQFIDTLKYSDIVTDFYPDTWYALAECITVYTKDDIRVTFRNGTTI